jgi:hypothetical protein
MRFSLLFGAREATLLNLNETVVRRLKNSPQIETIYNAVNLLLPCEPFAGCFPVLYSRLKLAD